MGLQAVTSSKISVILLLIEQLRWLENGYKIKVGITEQETIGIDTPEDMEKALAFLANR